jgi:NADPH:quinone reductase
MEEENGRLPQTPKTPTASAWLALMEDAPVDESNLGMSPFEQGERSRSQWSEGFWNLLLAESPSDELEAASCTQVPVQINRGRSEKSTNQQRYLKNEGERRAKPKDESDGNYNSSLLDMLQLQCGNLNTASFSKIEATITARLENVGSPCKLMSQRATSIFDEYDDDIYEIHTESVESFGIHYVAPNGSEDDIFIELQDEIPFLRERGEYQNASSKYKDILGATTSFDAIENAPKDRNPQSPSPAGQRKEAGDMYPLTSRKFPVENTIDQLSYRDRTPPTSTPTNGNLLKRATSSSTRKHQGSPVARSINTTKPDTATNKPSSIPLVVTTAEKGDRDVSPHIPSDVHSKIVDDILKKISTLSSEGDFQGTQFTATSNDVHPELEVQKMCMPPIFAKKIAMKNIKLSQSLSSTQSVKTSAIRSLRKNANNESVSQHKEDGHEYDYDYESNTHAYIAYFRRGTKATDSIRLYEQPIPIAFPTLEQEVVVRIEASTISGTDIQIRRGDFWGENGPQQLNLPIVPGVSFAGIVSQVSQSAYRTGLNIGDRVISLVQVGANSRHLCVNSKYLVKVPDEIKDPHSVACLPETYLTAFQALHIGQKNGARYRKTSLAGKLILVLGGGSTLGKALIEVSVAAGCETVYATEKEKHFEAISEKGGAPLGRDQKQWCSILSQKVDIIVGIDNSVGKSELSQEHIDLLARNGRVILLCRPGLHNKSAIDLDKQPELARTGRILYRYNVFDSWEDDLKLCKRDLGHLLKLYRDGSLRPRILERIPLFRVAKAQDLMEGKKLSGFILCEPWIKGKNKGEDATEFGVYAESASKSSDVEPMGDTTLTNAAASSGSQTMSHPDVQHTRTKTPPKLRPLDQHGVPDSETMIPSLRNQQISSREVPLNSILKGSNSRISKQGSKERKAVFVATPSILNSPQEMEI